MHLQVNSQQNHRPLGGLRSPETIVSRLTNQDAADVQPSSCRIWQDPSKRIVPLPTLFDAMALPISNSASILFYCRPEYGMM
mmetsp:Transcript_10271/g.28220  ORF Transcript_10271/g.28220 Transcript_10271/m.28220 type:complete len:82 (-) Transcript_10271:1169-1414(-)